MDLEGGDVVTSIGVFDWVDWTGIASVLLLIVLLALLWVFRYRDRD
jgi:hypothetical protein